MAGNDRQDGNAGDDVLVSDAGNETMTGDAGADAFLFAAAANRKANFDTITDFSVADDSLWFDRAVFGLTGTGPVTSISGFDIQAIDASEFQTGETATAGTADVRLIYETDTGILWYDADGNLSGKAVKLAQLGASVGLTAADVFVV
jgi:Ca2+-binding RTX toxin-like protein